MSEEDGRIRHSIEIGEGRVRVQWYDTCSDRHSSMGYDQVDYRISDFRPAGSAGQTRVRSTWGQATLDEVLAALP